MIELTPEQHKALVQNGTGPVRAIDRVGNVEYVLVRAEVYRRLATLLGDDTPDAASLMNEVMAEDDARDPYLEGYQHYVQEAPMNRGDVVLADFPFQDSPGSKIRPAVVVQSDAGNQALLNTILAMITGNLAEVARPTNVLVDPTTPEGAGSGLRGPSLVKCGNLATIRQQRILRVIGHLSDTPMQQVNAALKAALDLP